MFNFLLNILTIGAVLSTPIAQNIQPVIKIVNTYKNSPSTEIPVRLENESLGLRLSASSVYVLDKESSFSLYSKNSSKVLSAASITKLMTALVFLDTMPDWDEVYTVKTSDARSGNRVYIFSGEQITVRDLFSIMLVASSNEAAIALVNSTGIPLGDFINLMNKKAEDMQLRFTEFYDPTGLDYKNSSTAFDISILAREAFSRKEIADAAKQEAVEFTIINKGEVRTARNTNKLLDGFLNDKELGYSIIGAKTGYLDEVGYNMTIMVMKENHPVVITILGARAEEERLHDVKGIADWVFRNYRWRHG